MIRKMTIAILAVVLLASLASADVLYVTNRYDFDCAGAVTTEVGWTGSIPGLCPGQERKGGCSRSLFLRGFR